VIKPHLSPAPRKLPILSIASSCETQKMTNFLSNNSNSFNVSHNVTIADTRSEILAWLSPLDPRTRHQGIQIRRVDDVGEWLLQTDGFRGWCDSSGEGGTGNATLFCYGDPGVGKTYIRLEGYSPKGERKGEKKRGVKGRLC